MSFPILSLHHQGVALTNVYAATEDPILIDEEGNALASEYIIEHVVDPGILLKTGRFDVKLSSSNMSGIVTDRDTNKVYQVNRQARIENDWKIQKVLCSIIQKVVALLQLYHEARTQCGRTVLWSIVRICCCMLYTTIKKVLLDDVATTILTCWC